MVRIEAENLEKSFGLRVILRRVSFKIGEGERVGLIGKNGQGKSTLLNIIAGLEPPDGGTVKVRGRAGFLSQAAERFDGTLGTYLRRGGRPGYAAEKAMARVGLDRALLSSAFQSLSEGEKVKAALARILLDDPEILLLDEPTRHLDMRSLEWLEEFLAAFDGTVVVVSHDRRFLDRVIHRVLELEDGTLTAYSGNYSFYADRKQQMMERRREEYLAYTAERKRLEKAVREKMDQARRMAKKRRPSDSFQVRNQKDAYGTKAKKVARQAQALRTRIERLEARDKPRAAPDIKLVLEPGAPAASRFIVEARGIGKSYGGRVLFRDVSFAVEKGERVALVGDNGVGKTTLIRLIVGRETPDFGTVRIAPSVRIGYLDQGLAALTDDLTLLEEVIRKTGRRPGEARNVLASLLFRRDEVCKKVAVLSQGERVRLALAVLVLSGCNLLVLDEPTNCLDLPSREAVERALQRYEGSVLFVSHDRYFIDRVATRVLELAGGRLREPAGIPAESAGGADRLLLLETQLAEVSAQLALSAGTEQESILNKRFIALARRIAALKATR